MGERCEIYLRRRWNEGNYEIYEVVELWKHWAGKPRYMLPFFMDFFEFAKQSAGDLFEKCLSYPNDLAALMIAYDYEQRRELFEGMEESEKDFYTLRPDVRPRGEARDAEYAYILDLSESADFVEIRCYEVEDTNGLSEEDREALKRGEFPSRPEVLNLRLKIAK